ncbi:transcription termination/antitermination NusG family protein [Pseudomonas aeruginosa]|uniref:transcription termination/antitermination NusG family protein n=1 Tax=Pseudomonas aeruginosa TaxID=287 RepID=UPI002A6ADFE4|nr:transcription termination/antitermination NusG family protein [Pseudomonas aeruginosa]MDY1245670.1 transcription termination/antitermination NusG family protein [Pseudomonas aeruginosa]HCE0707521.1 transcriptional regulator [Pseudomonas aeruginosa]
MRNWYLLSCKSNAHQWVKSAVEQLAGVEAYSPILIEKQRRSDRLSGFRVKEKDLFPGYLFLRFDPEEVHTTQITRFPGAIQFVRFAGEPYVVPESVIQGLRDVLLLRVDRTLACIEYRNLPSELEKSLHLVVGLRSAAQRRARFLAILQHENIRVRRSMFDRSRIISVADNPVPKFVGGKRAVA